MNKLLLLLLLLLLGLLVMVWYQQRIPHAPLPVRATVRVIHRSDNPLLAHKRVQAVRPGLPHRP